MMDKVQREVFVGKVKKLLDEGCTIPEIVEKTKKPKYLVERAIRAIEIAKKRGLIE